MTHDRFTLELGKCRVVVPNSKAAQPDGWDQAVARGSAVLQSVAWVGPFWMSEAQERWDSTATTYVSTQLKVGLLAVKQ